MTTTIRRLGDLLEAIDLLSTDDSDGVHLSLFSPAGALPEDARQGRIHFSNAIAEAHLRLISTGIDEEVADRLLARPRAILDDEEFWNHQHGGVACFTTEQNCSLLSVGAELPCRGVVSASFWLRPLLAAAANADAFYLLTISQNSVMLLRGSELGIRVVDCPGLPESYHSAMEALGFPPDSSTMTAAESHLKASDEQLQKFFREINSAVCSHIGSDGLPLILACMESYAPLYRRVNSYASLSEALIAGNPEHVDEEELRKRCIEALAPHANASIERQLERIGDPDTPTAHGLKQVLAAAYQGRISSILLPNDSESWGNFDPLEDYLEEDGAPSMSNTDLYELAARRALDTGAEVFFTESTNLPDNGSPVAFLRWRQPENNPQTQHEK